jgi:hypothetical protein
MVVIPSIKSQTSYGSGGALISEKLSRSVGVPVDTKRIFGGDRSRFVALEDHWHVEPTRLLVEQ